MFNDNDAEIFKGKQHKPVVVFITARMAPVRKWTTIGQPFLSNYVFCNEKSCLYFNVKRKEVQPWKQYPVYKKYYASGGTKKVSFIKIYFSGMQT